MVTGEDPFASGANGSNHMVTGEYPLASGADGSNRMVTGEDPFASRANGSNRMGTDEAHQSYDFRSLSSISLHICVINT